MENNTIRNGWHIDDALAHIADLKALVHRTEARATRAESDLVAMRQRAEELEKERGHSSSALTFMNENYVKVTVERDAAIARAERAEEALKNLRGWTGMLAAQAKDIPPDIAEQILSVCKKADSALSSPSPNVNKMGGEQADMTIQWSGPVTPVIDCTTGKTFFVPRERRLEELVRDAFMQGWDAKDSDYPHGALSYSERAEEAWERSTARAALSPQRGGQKGEE